MSEPWVDDYEPPRDPEPVCPGCDEPVSDCVCDPTEPKNEDSIWRQPAAPLE